MDRACGSIDEILNSSKCFHGYFSVMFLMPYKVGCHPLSLLMRFVDVTSEMKAIEQLFLFESSF